MLSTNVSKVLHIPLAYNRCKLTVKSLCWNSRITHTFIRYRGSRFSEQRTSRFKLSNINRKLLNQCQKWVSDYTMHNLNIMPGGNIVKLLLNYKIELREVNTKQEVWESDPSLPHPKYNFKLLTANVRSFHLSTNYKKFL